MRNEYLKIYRTDNVKFNFGKSIKAKYTFEPMKISNPYLKVG